MAIPRCLVVTNVALAEFVQHLLRSQYESSLLVVCSSKETFVERLLAACTDSSSNDNDEQPRVDHEADAIPDDYSRSEAHALLKTLPLLDLTKSRNIKLAFCPDVTHLRAYLAALAASEPDEAAVEQHTNGNHRLLAILNPIEAHRPTSSFSAQGLNRTFALAVEAAHATSRSLLMAEVPFEDSRETNYDDENSPFEGEDARQPPPEDPWDEEVSILNVTTKSFGAGGRGWVGRTVSVRRIAERWCHFSLFDSGNDEF